MNLNIKIPDSWDKLDQRRLKTVFKYLASGSFSVHQCKVLLAFNFGGIKYFGMNDEGAIVKIKDDLIVLSEDDLLAIAHSVDFIEDIPKYPVRLFEIKHRKAVHPLLNDLTFAQWLAVENFYWGFLETENIALLNEILSILYPKSGLFSRFVKAFDAKKLDYTHVNVIKWLSSFKLFISNRYKELFKNINTEDNYSPSSRQLDIMESMNAQIRALTKGDITKKEAVLAMDVHSALTELDALALEARRLNESLKKSKK